MRRREFITLLGGAAAWPLAARAQQSGNAGDRFLGSDATANAIGTGSRRSCSGCANSAGSRAAMSTIEYRWAEGDSSAAGDCGRVRRLKSTSIVTSRIRTARGQAARRRSSRSCSRWRTRSAEGLVASLARPGGNVTGLVASMYRPCRQAAGDAARGRARAFARWRFHGQYRQLPQRAARLAKSGGGARSRSSIELKAGRAEDIDAAFAACSRARRCAVRRCRPACRSPIGFASITLGSAPRGCPTMYASGDRRRRRSDVLWTELSRTVSAARPIMSTAFSRARSRPICRSSSRPSSNWSSTSRPPRRSASTVPPTLLARADEVIE